MRQAKRPVSAALAGPYGHPFHPILVTVPIGAWVAGSVFDIASHVVEDPAFLARGAVWLIALGVLSALAAAAIGLSVRHPHRHHGVPHRPAPTPNCSRPARST